MKTVKYDPWETASIEFINSVLVKFAKSGAGDCKKQIFQTGRERMNGTKNMFVFVAALLLVLAHPLYVSADICDDTMDEAKRLYNSAMAASEQKQQARAIQLYETAEKYYQKASLMKNCRCPKIEKSSKANVQLCRENVSNIKRYLESQRKYEAQKEAQVQIVEAQVKVVEIYEQAASQYNQGNSYAQSGQWQNAINAFENAARIWDSIASTQTENGNKAIQNAKQARELAALARQRMGQK